MSMALPLTVHRLKMAGANQSMVGKKLPVVATSTGRSPVPEQGGFHIDKLESMYLPGPKIATYNYRGIATQK